MRSIYQKLNLLAFLFLFVILNTPLFSQFVVKDVTPPRNSITADIASQIAIHFGEAVDAVTIFKDNIKVFGNQSGFCDYNSTLNDGGKIITIQTARPFKIGERVTVNITTSVKSLSGSELAESYQWSFTINGEIGDGTFKIIEDFALGENDSDPIVTYPADFNNDGFPDLAVVCSSSNSVTILQNGYMVYNGGLFFRGSIPVGAGPTSITGADLDSNGYLDLVVGNFHGNSISILWNSAGEFTQDSLVVGDHPSAVEAYDFDNDGDFDIAVALLGTNKVRFLQNSGSGQFTLSEPLDTQSTPTSIAVGDFDLDGDADMAVANSGSKSISIFVNEGSFSFNPYIQEMGVSPLKLLANDVIINPFAEPQDEQTLDLVVLAVDNGEIRVLEDISNGIFSKITSFHWPGRTSSGVLANIDCDPLGTPSHEDGDFDLDIILTDFFGEKIGVMLNNSGEELNYSSSLDMISEKNPTSITALDLNLDGNIDLAVTNLQTNKVRVFRNAYPACGCFSMEVLDLIFGDVFVGDDSTLIFKIESRSGNVINVTEITSSSPIFNVIPTSGIIEPGRDLAISVTFSPDDTLNYAETILVVTDSHLPPQYFNVRLFGRGVRAILAFEPDSLDFGVVPPGLSKVLAAKAYNLGNTNLELYGIQYTGMVFSSEYDFISKSLPLIVPPYQHSLINFQFQPQQQTTYVDTATVLCNDFDNPVSKITLIGKCYQNRPEITSLDTAVAIEHQYFEYIATAIDPDGTIPVVHFDNYPNWLQSADSTLSGTPPEGEKDTWFTVIASDGFLEDTLQVYLKIIPINDPPILNFISDKRIFEQHLLQFQISASDPEDSLLQFSIQGLPSGAEFRDNGDCTADFDWIPSFGAAGGSSKEYPLIISVKEVKGENPLGAFQNVLITVQRLLPDLQVTDLTVDREDARLNQTRKFTALIKNEIAPVYENIRVALNINDRAVADTTLAPIKVGDEEVVTLNYKFTNLGPFSVKVWVDPWNTVPEADENNNIAQLQLFIEQGSLLVSPNPFTPNSDGYNDNVTFDINELALKVPRLKIFNFEGEKVIEKQFDFASSYFRWNGRNDNGNELKPGIYLFVLEDGNKKVETGYVVLAR